MSSSDLTPAGVPAPFATLGLTFDDVLLQPNASDVIPSQADASTQFSKRIRLNIPLVSAAMDTVTEARLAIAMAQEGGIGIVHKNLTAKQQAAEVARVKRYESGVVRDPITIGPDTTVRQVIELSQQHGVSGFPVVEGKTVVGIVTNRDLRFETDDTRRIEEVMTSKNLITAPVGTTLEEAKKLLAEHRIEKLPIVNDQYELCGLITIKDIEKTTKYPNSAKDDHGRLLCGAAVESCLPPVTMTPTRLPAKVLGCFRMVAKGTALLGSITIFMRFQISFIASTVLITASAPCVASASPLTRSRPKPTPQN